MSRLPLDVIVQFILPHSFHSKRDALNGMLVCKKSYAASHEVGFWGPLVARAMLAVHRQTDAELRLVLLMFWRLPARDSILGSSMMEEVRMKVCATGRFRRLYSPNTRVLLEGEWADRACATPIRSRTFCPAGMMEKVPLRDEGFHIRIVWLCGMRLDGSMDSKYELRGDVEIVLADGKVLRGHFYSNTCLHCKLDELKEEMEVVVHLDLYGKRVDLPFLTVVDRVNHLRYVANQERGVLERADKEKAKRPKL